MGLLDLQTDLKSYKFGVSPVSDRPGGGNSGEPYIKKTIDRNIVPQSEDFLLRGGLNAPLDAATDVARLAKFFTDLKSPRGALFVAKQNVLSLTGVRTQAATFASPNDGVYTPLNTLAQAGIGFLGASIPKQGLIPGLGVRLYGPKSSFNPISITAVEKVIGGEDGSENRLVQLTNLKINKSIPFKSSLRKNQIAKNDQNILSYVGGPNSQLGIGKTNIKFATDNKGAPLRTNTGGKILGIGLPNNKSHTTFTPDQIKEFSRVLRDNRGSIIDFRKTILNNQEITPSLSDNNLKKSSTILSFAPSYNPANKKTIDGADGSRINYTSPGQRGNIISYTAGKIVNGRVSIVDKINAQPIYQSKQVTEDNDIKNDLVKFRIAALNNENPNLKQYIHFRAYIDSFSDTYGAGWSGTSYMGRGEKFWKIRGFDRDINLSFTVAAQSKPELMAQYKKLNFLASNLAPVYSSKGYMGGPLVTLTMGGWCYELPGFIKGLTLDVPTESPWEIGINDKGKFDKTVKEMPHIVKVSGFSFVPIHTFRPEKQQNLYGGEPDGGLTKPANISKYGSQRYLALANGKGIKNNNYDDKIIDNGKI